jgi:hypothetical protein
MSDWPEEELARELALALAPVAAPRMLRIRLGFAPVKRWEFPRAALAVAAAVVMIIGGGYAASRTAALDLRRQAGADVPLRTAAGVPSAGARLLRCDGGAGMPLQVNAGKATVLLAHSGFERPAHTPAAAPEAGCHLCHSL